MRVAMLSPVTWRTPPRNYGPWEQVVSVLTENLVARGFEVTLFATGDSITKAKLQFVCYNPLGEYPGDAKVAECLHISNLMEQSSAFDIIHNHFDFLPLTYSRLINTPVITTIHGFSSPDIVPVYKKYNQDGYYVSISDSDRNAELSYIDTIYNGLDEDQFEFGPGTGDYLLYFGRIHPHKGAYEAIQIASQSNRKLILCGLIQDQHYFDEKIASHIDGASVSYQGNVGPVERNKLLGNAQALLHPISFEEPFGLSVAEAMMCGTPVIAFNRGSMKELVQHNITGYLVKTVEEAAASVGAVHRIGRRQCRDYAIDKFSGSTMAQRYASLYERIVATRTRRLETS